MCNFACSYCPEYLHDGKVGFPDYIDALYFVEQLSVNKPDMFMEILGGETTMWPKLQDFLKNAVKLNPNLTIEINTNGSRTRNWWNRFVQCDLQDNVVLNFSYHAAFCDPNLFYDNLEIVSEAGYAVVANYMLDPEYFDKSRRLYERTIQSLNVDTSMKVLRPDFRADELIDGYTDEMLNFISNSNEDIVKIGRSKNNANWNMQILFDGKSVNWQKAIIQKKHSFTLWNCSAGSKRFFVDMSGDVWACSELVGTQDYLLGNIFERNFKPLDNMIPCPVSYCACKVDALCYKHD